MGPEISDKTYVYINIRNFEEHPEENSVFNIEVGCKRVTFLKGNPLVSVV